MPAMTTHHIVINVQPVLDEMNAFCDLTETIHKELKGDGDEDPRAEDLIASIKALWDGQYVTVAMVDGLPMPVVTAEGLEAMVDHLAPDVH